MVVFFSISSWPVGLYEVIRSFGLDQVTRDFIKKRGKKNKKKKTDELIIINRTSDKAEKSERSDCVA